MTARLLTALLAVTCFVPATAQAREAPRLVGDARLMYYSGETERGDGSADSEEGARLRLRFGAEGALSGQWRLRGRVAGRFGTERERSRIWLKAWAPTRGGLDEGDVTVDELFLRFLPAGDRGSVRIGRFQARFALNDLMGKSLDHRDSPSANVTWTDGIHWRHHLTDGWRWHSLARFNASRGSGAVTRGPLVFDHSGSGVTLFTGLQGTDGPGPVAEHMIGITWMPNTLATDGIAAPRREDYVTLTARALAEWPLGQRGMLARVGVEAGYAPNTPTGAAMGLESAGRTGGAAGQLSLGLNDFIPRHDVSVVYGRTDAGWLISPNFRENDELLELRYRWRVAPRMSLEARVRRREEREIPAAALRGRVDEDMFVRVSVRL